MTASTHSAPRTIRFEDCVLDTDARELRRGDSVVEVEPRVFDLLCLLAGRPEHCFTRDEIAEALWPGRVISDSVISQAVKKARQACGDSGDQQRIIKTLRGVGYRFGAEPCADNGEDAAAVGSTSRHAQTGFSRPVRYALWALTGLVFIGLLSLRPWQVSSPELPHRITIASLPAAESTALGDSLSAGLEVLLGRMTEERSDIQLIGSQRTRRTLEGLGLDIDADDAELLVALRQTLGAEYVIRSLVIRDGEGYEIRAELTGPGGRSALIEPQAGDLASMVSGFASELARELGSSFRQDGAIPLLSADNFVNEVYMRALNALLAGDSRAAATLFNSVLELDPGLAYARYERGNALWQLGEHAQAREYYELSLEQALNGEAFRLAGHACTMLGVLDWQGGALEQAEDWYRQALAHYAAAGEEHGAASALGNLGNLAMQRGEHERAAELLLQAQDRFVAAGDLVGQSAVFTNLALISRRRSRLHEAHRYQSEAVDIQSRLGVGSMLTRSLSYLAALEMELGNWDEAEELLAEAMAMAIDQDNRLGVAEARLEQARLAAFRLRAAEALAIAERALADFGDLQMPGFQALALGIAAEAELELGDAQSALERLDLADELDQNINTPRERASRRLLRARVLQALQRCADAAAVLDDLVADADAFGVAQVQAGRASLAWAADEPTAALAKWREALDSMEALDEPSQRALLRVRLAAGHLDHHDFEAAGRYLRLAAAWNPDNPRLLLEQARMALKRGETAAASAIMANLAEATDLPEHSAFGRRLIDLQHAVGQTAQADSGP